MTRRRFLKMAALAGAAALSPRASLSAPPPAARTLSLHNLHTGENLDVEYCRDGCYDADAVARINHFLRCHYTGEQVTMDLRVVDLLSELQSRMAAGRRVEIVSGYRSPAYNELLRRQGRGVAANSLHLTGLAIDFAVPGRDTEDLFLLARAFQVGGVGRYPEFVHIDAGRVRCW